ncbi:unnamed protein product [Linum trigynum]|uniref:Uncharacterized protein n=1 Tax=Linum trigynum TaxID=586398 RepID=A0AAV2DNK8_9ROSI
MSGAPELVGRPVQAFSLSAGRLWPAINAQSCCAAQLLYVRRPYLFLGFAVDHGPPADPVFRSGLASLLGLNR